MLDLLGSLAKPRVAGSPLGCLAGRDCRSDGRLGRVVRCHSRQAPPDLHGVGRLGPREVRAGDYGELQGFEAGGGAPDEESEEVEERARWGGMRAGRRQ